MQNHSTEDGGGVCGASVRFCSFTNNSATGIGGAIAAGNASDSIVVSNSAYYGGGMEGGTHYRCTLIANQAEVIGGGAHLATLTACTLVQNNIIGDTGCGGGAYHCTLSACKVSGNFAAYGGGACFSFLADCVVTANSAIAGAGVSFDPFFPDSYCTLNNCTVVANSAETVGGGAVDCTLKNSIIYYNHAPADRDCSASIVTNCCTTVFDTVSPGNMTNAPMFIDLLTGNFHLQTNSPCVNAGANEYVTSISDMDGNPRILYENVDLGAFELGTAGLSPFHLWLESYNLPTDGTVDKEDEDHDGMDNWEEYQCNTNPTNGGSVLRLLPLERTDYGILVRFQGERGVSYFLQRSPDSFTNFTTIYAGITAERATNGWICGSVDEEGPIFFRVGVRGTR